MQYKFKKWKDGNTDNPRTINLIANMTLTAIYEEVSEITYKPSEVTILVHAKSLAVDSSLIAKPTEIGTVDLPVDEGTVVPITGTLTETATENPIVGKTLHLYYPDGAEVGIGVTDANGQATINYTVRVEDDSQTLSMKYLGD